MARRICVLLLVVGMAALVSAQQRPDDAAVNIDQLRRPEPPSPTATPEALEKQGDLLRGQKAFVDAIDYYRAALKKVTGKDRAPLYNKVGISLLKINRLDEARKEFERASKADKTFSEAFNNAGATLYLQKKYKKAIKEYEKAIALNSEAASFFSNLGTAYFNLKEFDKAMQAYGRAVELDPEVFDRRSAQGISAQLASPEDRARYSYMIAKMYAANGNVERCLVYLRKAIEDGFKVTEQIEKDAEFAIVRKDPRYAEFMAQRITPIPQ